MQTLQKRVTNACNQLRDQAGVTARVRDSLRRRAEARVRMRGDHIENLLSDYLTDRWVAVHISTGICFRT